MKWIDKLNELMDLMRRGPDAQQLRDMQAAVEGVTIAIGVLVVAIIVVAIARR